MSLVKDVHACALYGHDLRLYTDGSERCLRPGCGYMSLPLGRKARTDEYIRPEPLPFPAAEEKKPNAPSHINLGGHRTPTDTELVLLLVFTVLGIGAICGGLFVRFFLL